MSKTESTVKEFPEAHAFNFGLHVEQSPLILILNSVLCRIKSRLEFRIYRLCSFIYDLVRSLHTRLNELKSTNISSWEMCFKVHCAKLSAIFPLQNDPAFVVGLTTILDLCLYTTLHRTRSILEQVFSITWH